MNGTFYRASSEAEGHLSFDRNRLIERDRIHNGRAIRGHAFAERLAAKELNRRLIVFDRIFFGKDSGSGINTIKVAGICSQPNDAYAAHQQHDDE